MEKEVEKDAHQCIKIKPRWNHLKITYNVGDYVIMKPINVNMGGRSEGTIQHKNVRIDKIDNDNYIGTIFSLMGNKCQIINSIYMKSQVK